MAKISITEACKIANISKPTLYKHINSGEISIVKDGKRTFIESSELIRFFPDVSLNQVKGDVKNLHDLTVDIQHQEEIINLLKQQLSDRQKENDFLREQLTQVNNNFTLVNNILQDKNQVKTKKRKKFLGIF